MAKTGKNFTEAAAKVEERTHQLNEAIEKVQEASFAKFDETVEIAMRLGVDPKHADQMVRGTVVLPHGTGRSARVLVFAQGEKMQEAEAAGADHVGGDELAKKIQDGWTDFDVAIAVPSMMGQVGRLGRVLGPRGLMPNPRAGTVAPGEDLPRLIEEAKAGRVEFRIDRTSNIHAPFGKAGFIEEQLLDNLQTILDSIKRARPASAKGAYIRSLTLANTMGPGIKVDPAEALS